MRYARCYPLVAWARQPAGSRPQHGRGRGLAGDLGPRLRYEAGHEENTSIAGGAVVTPPASAQAAPVQGAGAQANSLRGGPDGRGRFGDYGGRFVAETLMPLILDRKSVV